MSSAAEPQCRPSRDRTDGHGRASRDLDALGRQQSEASFGACDQAMDQEAGRISSVASMTGDGAEMMRKLPQVPIQSMWRWPCITTTLRPSG